jgi:hypothetical protein
LEPRKVARQQLAAKKTKASIAASPTTAAECAEVSVLIMCYHYSRI